MNVLDALGEWTIHPGPLYQRLATAIRVAVLRGELPPGTLLPAERQFARLLAVGRSTVVGAYDLLRADGVLVSRQGSGSWIAGADRLPASRASAESLRGAALTDIDTLIDLATAALPPAPLVRDALASLPTFDLDRLLSTSGYSALGLPELRQAVASRFSLEGLPTSSEQILITTGGQQALALITQHFLNSSDTVVVEDPTSPGMLDLVRALPVAIRGCRSLSGAGPEPLLEAIRRANPSLVYLFGALGPEGYVSSPEVLAEFARRLGRFQGTLVEDTSARHLIAGELPPYLAAASAVQVVTIGSMSKLFWAGLRIGWIRAEESVILRLSRAKARQDLGTPVLTQLCATWLLARLGAVRAQRLAELTRRAEHARQVLQEKLPELPVQNREGGTLWLRLPRGASGPLSELARRHGVAVVPGSSLSPAGLSDDFIRIAIGQPPALFEDGVRRLSEAWRVYAAMGSADPEGGGGEPLV